MHLSRLILTASVAELVKESISTQEVPGSNPTGVKKIKKFREFIINEK